MNYMQVELDEISKIRDFIASLNSITDGVIIVEGKKDSQALKSLGLEQKILEYHKFGGLVKFADSVSSNKNLILLFDFDKKGRYMTRKVIELLQNRTKIDLFYKKRLTQITGGKIRAIEELSLYEKHLNN
mgnify:FL=1